MLYDIYIYMCVCDYICMFLMFFHFLICIIYVKNAKTTQNPPACGGILYTYSVGDPEWLDPNCLQCVLKKRVCSLPAAHKPGSFRGWFG